VGGAALPPPLFTRGFESTVSKAADGCDAGSEAAPLFPQALLPCLGGDPLPSFSGDSKY